MSSGNTWTVPSSKSTICIFFVFSRCEGKMGGGGGCWLNSVASCKSSSTSTYFNPLFRRCGVEEGGGAG